MRIDRATRYTTVLFAIGCAIASSVFAAEAPSAEPFTRLFDTAKPSDAPLEGSEITSRAGWKSVPSGTLEVAFSGDAVFLNDRIAVVLRKSGHGAEVYSLASPAPALSASLTLAGTDATKPAVSIKVTNNEQDAISVEAVYAGENGESQGMKIELSLGQLFVKVQPLHNTRALVVNAPSDAVVLPDFFADDIVLSAADIPGDTADLPSENFLLQLGDAGNRIVMSVWDKRDQEVRVQMAQASSQKSIESTQIAFGEGNSIWVAVLADRGIWHRRKVSRGDRNRVVPLKWKPPFPAVWRVDWRKRDTLTDSWEMAIENPDGSFRKSDLFEVSRDDWTDEDWWADDKPRKRWNTGGLGGYMYPCWIDKKGKAYLQPLKKQIQFEGPAFIYPINRSAETPLSAFTITDVVRATLGMGPCQYILDLEGQGLAFQGKPTCATRDILNPIYEEGDQTAHTADVTHALDDVLAFMRLIRGRIEQYRAFNSELQSYLSDQKAKNPDLAGFIDSMLDITHAMDESVEKHKEGMNTPEHATALVDEFRNTLVGYQGADAFDRCKTLTKGFVTIGDNQDELVAECRRAVKMLRQRSALEQARDPRVAPIVAEIRTRTQAMLRDPVNYEAARH